MSDLKEETSNSHVESLSDNDNFGKSDGDNLLNSTFLLLKAFAKTYKKIHFDFPTFVKFTSAYLEQYGNRFKELKIITSNPKALLFKSLEDLEKKHKVSLAYKGAAIESIYFPLYAVLLLQKAYEDIERNPEAPFPTDETLGVTVPSDLVASVDVPNGFNDLLKSKPSKTQSIIRLTFPSGIQSILIIPEILPRQLLDYALNKIRVYMSKAGNASFIQSRLRPAFRDHQVSMQTTLNNIVIKPSTAVSSIIEASDFSFRFWANFSNLLTREQSEKRDLLISESNLAQAAYILGVVNVYYRELVRNKATERAETLKSLDSELKRPPYAYTLKDLLNLRDKQGTPLIKPDDMERVTKFLSSKTRPAKNRMLPDLVIIRAGQGREYYIYKNQLPLVFVQKLRETAMQMRNYYLESWPEAIRNDEKPASMDDDNQFLQDIRARLSTNYPLCNALLDYNLLNGVERETKIRPELLPEFNSCFNRRLRKLKPLNEILKLDRGELSKITKKQLRFWERYKVFRKLVALLFGLFSSSARRTGTVSRGQGQQTLRKGFVKIQTDEDRRLEQAGLSTEAAARAPGAGGTTYTDKKAAYEKAVQVLKEHFVGKGLNASTSLKELADKWNPLFDRKARENLIEDVNSMIRDYIRGLRKGFRIKPPNVERLEAIAQKLSQHSAFERIKKRELFKHYIEIYMITLLEETGFTRRK